MFFKDEDSLEWQGPTKVLAIDGKVAFVKLGNNLRRVHTSRMALNEKEESHEGNVDSPTANPSTLDVSSSEKDTAIEKDKSQKKEKKNDEMVKHDDTATGDLPFPKLSEDKDETVDTLPKRKSSLQRPEKQRKIKFKRNNSFLWKEGEVIKPGDKKEPDQYLCHILLENEDVVVIDFSDGTTH